MVPEACTLELEGSQTQQSQMIKNLERLILGIKYLLCQLTHL